jgi:sulfide dehydrogenase cytochrome subunit
MNLSSTSMKQRLIGAAALVLVAPMAAATDSPSPDAGRDLAAACAICHGTNGWSAGGRLPHLAGQPQEYLVRQMRDFRDGKRPATIMTQIAKGYTEEQYQLIAAFFASQKTKRGAP